MMTKVRPDCLGSLESEHDRPREGTETREIIPTATPAQVFGLTDGRELVQIRVQGRTATVQRRPVRGIRGMDGVRTETMSRDEARLVYGNLVQSGFWRFR